MEAEASKEDDSLLPGRQGKDLGLRPGFESAAEDRTRARNSLLEASSSGAYAQIIKPRFEFQAVRRGLSRETRRSAHRESEAEADIGAK
jgi:hypothetical protein